MGKSAKLHKRVPKKLKSSSTTANPPTPAASSSRTQVESSKKRSTLKQKTNGSTKSGNRLVLGEADYVSLLMGSRRKVREEAKKLPKDES